MRIIFDDNDRADVINEYKMLFERSPSDATINTMLGLIEMAITSNCFGDEMDYFFENNVDDDGNFITDTDYQPTEGK